MKLKMTGSMSMWMGVGLGTAFLMAFAGSWWGAAFNSLVSVFA